ncbi:hypothetical protein [Chitinimonas naiadis]
MMRAVLYTNDLEPITVVELSEFIWRMLEERGFARLAVPAPPFVIGPPTGSPDRDAYARVVTLRALPAMHGNARTLLLVTGDDESALLLQAAFLPGQYGAVQERKATAFARGVFNALTQRGPF